MNEAWLKQTLALVHGDDRDAAQEAVRSWKDRHVDQEWADFSLRVCSENASWNEVMQALTDGYPQGPSHLTVIVPCAENLIEKKDVPKAFETFQKNPPDQIRLLLIASRALPKSPGKALGHKFWKAWVENGQVLTVGEMTEKEAPAFVQQQAAQRSLKIPSDAAQRLIQQLGPHPGLLRRAIEVLDLLADSRTVTLEQVDQTTFKLSEQNLYAWTKAWKSGNFSMALQALHHALDDQVEPVILVGQARTELGRVAKCQEGLQRQLSSSELLDAVGLQSKQMFLLDDYARVARRLKKTDVQALLNKVALCDRDVKGRALQGSPLTLIDLTVALARVWKASLH